LGEVLTLAEARTRSVVVSGAPGEVLVGLDDHAFRRVPAGKVRLSELLLEDEELAPGPHRVVVMRDAEGTRSAVWSWFLVTDEAAATAALPPPGVVLSSPQGTYNGDAAADAVIIEAFALESRRPLLVRVHGVGWAVERRTSGEPLRVQGLPSGDIRVEATELGEGASSVPAAGPWATMSRVITVNRDAPRRPGP
jgi:hypothetical protein